MLKTGFVMDVYFSGSIVAYFLSSTILASKLSD